MRAKRPYLRIGCLLAVVCLAFGAGRPGPGAQRRALHGHVPAVVKQSQTLGRLPVERQLRLCIGLQMRNQAELDALLHDLYDPASPRYHHFLTPEQFAAEFSPTPQEHAAVVAFARAHGLMVSATLPDRRMIDVSGSAANIEQAFHVTLKEYHHPSRTRKFYAPDVEPSVDAGLRVADVWGISDYPEPHVLHQARPRAASAMPNGSGGTGPSDNFMGADFRNAYVPGVTNLTGAGQIVGLFQVDGFYTNDITLYASQTGQPVVPLQTVLLDGFTGVPFDFNGTVEVSLDIEMAMSMAPGLSRIIVYEGNPNADSFFPAHVLSRIAADNLARQVSCSWAWSGGPDATFDSYLQQMMAQGQAFFQASGDSGAYPVGYVDNSANNTTPMDSPYLTCVGGISLNMAGGVWQSETVWSSGGGGSSSYYAIPSWQQGVSMASNQGSTVYRNIPDVAMPADNIFVRYNNGAAGAVSGTSCAAPLWAGFCALVNQQAAINAVAPVGFVNSAIYAIGKGSNYAAAFHDTTNGNNFSVLSPAKYVATNGYDLCTGWGTPKGSNLINALVPFNALRISPLITPAVIGSVGGPFAPASDRLTLVNAGATTMTWSAGTTSTWFTLTPTNGTLLAGRSTNVFLAPAANATGLVAQVYAGSAWFTNTLDGSLQTRGVSLLVGQPVVQNGGFETGDLTGWNNYGFFDYNVVLNTGTNYGYAYGNRNGNPVNGIYFAHSGGDGLLLGATGSLGYVSQTLQTVSNRPYLLSFWLRNLWTNTPNEFLVQWGGQTVFDQANMGQFEWSNLQFVVMANDPRVVLALGAQNDRGEFALDDISAQLLASPTCSALSSSTNATTFAWSASSNVHYQAQYATNLTAPQWVNLGALQSGSNGTMSATDPAPVSPQRFYRVVVEP